MTRKPTILKRILPLTLATLVVLTTIPVLALPPTEQGTRPPSSTTNLDPCAFATPDQLKPLVTIGLSQVFPVKYSKKGKHVTISKPRLGNLICPKLSFSAGNKIRYKKTRGVPQYSTSGKLRFRSQLVARLSLRPGARQPIHPTDIRKAEACTAGLKVTSLDLRRVPNWLDNTWVRDKLNDNLSGRLCVDITPYVRAYLAQGGSLSSSSTALHERRGGTRKAMAAQPKVRAAATPQEEPLDPLGDSTDASFKKGCSGKRCFCKKGPECDKLVKNGTCKKEDMVCRGTNCSCKRSDRDRKPKVETP